jgi:tetratricopeptide (TPR) repeat protein
MTTKSPKPKTPPASWKHLDIPDALKLASNQIDAGKLAPAENVLRDVLTKQPKNPVAIHLLGLIAHRVGRIDEALQLISSAIELAPTNAQFHRNIGEMYRMAKRVDEAVAYGEKAVQLDPKDPIAHSNLGIAYYDRKDFLRAEECQLKALKLNSPNLIQALNNLGSIRRGLKDKEGAAAYFEKVLKIDPTYLEAKSNLAGIWTEMGRYDEAVVALVEVIRARPQYADAHCNIGNAFILLDQNDKAFTAFNRVLQLQPNNVSAMLGKARVFKERDDFDQALKIVAGALTVEPNKAESYCLQGDIMTKMGSYDEALHAYEIALKLDDKLMSTHLGLGQAQMELGRLEEAQESYRVAMAIDPEEVAPHVLMAQAKKIKTGDESLIRLEKELEKIDTMPKQKEMSLHFALGKSYDDLKEYDKAFEHFDKGCRQKRATIQYDAANHDLACENIREFFTKEKLAELRGGGCQSDVPIFVVGMPRSGTTLTETIIASHPGVFGAGELRDALAIANNPIEGKTGEGFPLSMKGLTRDDFTRMGNRYLESVRQRSDAKHISDKMPANFLVVGMIHLMLPNAKIVHIKRNAADTCLSGFTKLFNNSQYHSYDLTEIGRYYANYAKIMEHWASVLPEGAFLEVQYEDLVSDKEAQTRRLIDYCGLEWNDACLESHKAERSVKTASITQVRQPVYTTSVERWRRYEQHLQPLLKALGKYAPT